MRGPDFIILGAQKAGTTSLHNILNSHPNIYIPKGELNFFNFEENYKKGFEWYCQNYFDNIKHEIVGERSTWYLHSAEAPHNIYNNLGTNVKLIATLRNPAVRAFSHYFGIHVNHGERNSFNNAINLEKAGKSKTTYLKWGLYGAQIQNYYNVFSPEQIKIFIFEEFYGEKRQELINELADFLGIDGNLLEYRLHSNKSKQPRNRRLRDLLNEINGYQIINNTKIKLYKHPAIKKNLQKIIYKKQNSITAEQTRILNNNYFIQDIHDLEEILGRDLKIWYK